MVLDIFSSLDFQIDNFSIFSWVVWLIGVVWFILFFKKYFILSKNFYYFLKNVGGVYLSKFESPKTFTFKFMFQFLYSFSLFILMVNLWSLCPYVYGITTNLVMGLSFALCMWFCINLSGLMNKVNSYVSHYVSFGSPLALGFMLSYVDLMSSLVRPLTLTLRLAINISIGHVIFCLLGTMVVKYFFNKIFFCVLVFSILIGFLIVEVCVSVIQSLVFGLLGVNYLGEHKLINSLSLKTFYLQ